MQLLTSGVKPMISLVYLSVFAFISPLGALVGLVMSGEVRSEESMQGVGVTVLQGLATGTLLYVVFFEVIEKERVKGTNGLCCVTCILVGFGFMLAVAVLETASGADPHHAPDSGPGGPCTLAAWKSEWSTPKSFSCVEGFLVP